MAPLDHLHIRMTLPTLSPVLDPVSINLSYFTTFTTQDLTDVADLTAFLVSSFNTIPAGGSQAPSAMVGGTVDRGTNKALWQVYDVSSHLTGVPAGSPVLVGSWTVGAGGAASPMPEGVCAVVTLQAPYGTDVEFAPGMRPRARDRGRVYFGPLAASQISLEAGSNRAYVASVCRTDLTKWIQKINVYTTTPHTVVYNLGVWSKKNGSMKSLQETWVDDRPDYQRRRADQATIKTIQSLP